MLDDGGRLADSQVEPTVELDEIFNAFDKPTRDAFQEWVRELSKAIKGGRGQDLNDAFGNLEGFAVDGSTLLKELDQQEVAVRRLIKNTGVVFGAINEREGALGELIVNANNTFEATASRDAALAETFRVFPTFLDESKATLARLETLLERHAPAGERAEGPGGRPGADGARPGRPGAGPGGPVPRPRPADPGVADGPARPGAFLRGGEPVFESAHVFFPELNPILSLVNFHQATVAGFITNAAADLTGPAGQARRRPLPDPDRRHQRALFDRLTRRPARENGNAYSAPNATNRGWPLGVHRESFDCKPSGGERKNPDDQLSAPARRPRAASRPASWQPRSLYNGKQFNKLDKGEAPVRKAPTDLEGNAPTDPSPLTLRALARTPRHGSG